MHKADASLGLTSNVVRLEQYNLDWPHLYRAEEALLRCALGPYALDIQHVGSTAIPGMLAKPILDIAIAVADYYEAAGCVSPLEALGYRYRGENGIPRRHYFVKGDPVTHHLHSVEARSEQWATMVRFRDRLLADPDTASAYGALKRRLAEQFANERTAYQDGKAEFIRGLLGGGQNDAGAPGD